MSTVAGRLEAPPSGPSRVRRLADDPTVRLALRALVLLAAYLVLQRWLMGVARLPAESYEGPVLAAGLLDRFIADAAPSRGYLLRVGTVLAIAGLAALRPRRVLGRWADLSDGPLLRLLVGVPTVLLAWAFATYDYNLWFDRAHLADRIALLALGGLVVWRPLFVLPFVTLAAAVVWQFNHPIGGFSVAEPFLLVRWLLLFLAFFLLRAAGTGHRPSDFVLLAFTLLAASYFVAGLGKLQTGWFGLGDVALLLPATFANGWLGFLDAGTVGTLTRWLWRADPALVAGTLVVECGALVCLARRRVFLSFLVLWPAFHVAVFALSGIFFWKWMLLEAAILGTMLKRPDARLFRVFTPGHFLLSVPLIVGGTIWFHPVDLTWYNAAVSYVYRFEAVGESGRRYSLPPRFFAPYDYQFTLGAFAYASPRRQLDVVWGAMNDRELVAATNGARTAREVEALEREHGERAFDEARARRLDAFLERFVRAYGERGSKETALGVLAPPPHLWTFAGPDAFEGQEPIVRVEVWQVTSFFDGVRYRELGPRRVRAVEISREMR